MVLVDTTVWVDFFSDRPEPHVEMLQDLIEKNKDLCLCGVILTEVLQGIRHDSDYRRVKNHFEALILLPMQQTTFILAADIYRSLRKKGITIRKPIDCMIASVALEYNLPLLHNDRDFERIAQHTKLKIMKLKKPTKASSGRDKNRD